MSSKGKRKWVHHYKDDKAKKRRRYAIEPGMQGFLCTCNAKERDCVKEAYNILNDYADRLYGEEKLDNASNSDASEEIEDELQKEVDSLKVTGKSNARRFQAVNSGANNCIFIKSMVPDPLELASSIMKDIDETRQQKTRYLIRLVPVEVVCKANLEEIKKECEKMFERHFKCEPTTYGVAYNKRYNDSFLRDEVIDSVARLVQDRNILHKVDLKQANKTIIVEIIKNICCLSVITDYYKLKKYNLLELSKKCDSADKDETKLVDSKDVENQNGEKNDGQKVNEQALEKKEEENGGSSEISDAK